jgi:hypothetical protein
MVSIDVQTESHELTIKILSNTLELPKDLRLGQHESLSGLSLLLTENLVKIHGGSMELIRERNPGYLLTFPRLSIA